MARGTRQNAKLVATRYGIVWFASHLCIQANLVFQAVEARLESKPLYGHSKPSCRPTTMRSCLSQALHYHLIIIKHYR